MSTMVPAPRYYPRLSEIITIDDLPESMSFIKDGLNGFFDKMHYKNLQYSKSKNGDAAFYSLDIVTAKRIQIKLPFDINFVLNPDYSGGDSNISSFPITLEYQWQILAFLKSFNLNGFSFSIEDFYELGLKIFRITDEQVLGHILNNFVEQADPLVSIQQQVVDDINLFYGFTQGNNNLLELPANVEPTNQMVITAIKQHPDIDTKSSALLFSIYLVDSGSVTAKEKLQKFYKNIVPEGIESYIRKLITPKARATFALSAAIEFPRSILKPVYDETGHSPFDSTTGTPFSVIPATQGDSPKAQIKFAEAQFYADTEQGLGYSLDIALSFVTPVQIGNTKLILFLQNLKLDLSKTSNPAEVNQDGRPVDFMGVYVEEAMIGFPKAWSHDTVNSTAYIKGRKLIIGTGGISGMISLESTVNPGNPNVPATLFKLGGNDDGKHFQLGLTSFEMEMKQGSVVKSDIKGFMKVPGLKIPTGQPNAGQMAKIDIEAHFGQNGDFRVTASVATGIKAFELPNIFRLDVRSVSLGEKDDKWYIEASGSLTITANIPGVGPILAKQPIDIKLVRIWQDGSIEFEGGKIPIPVHIPFKIGPASIAISNITFGPHKGMHGGIERQYFFFGFNGALNTGSGGVDVQGNGIEFHFTRDNDVHPLHMYLRIQSLAVDIKIPGNATKEKADVLIHGWLAMKSPTAPGQPDLGVEYSGGVTMDLNKLKIHGKADMAMMPKVPAWIVDVELELPSALPLGATGLGIYGFRGLLGSHYVASRPYIGLTDEDPWFEYLKKGVDGKGQGIYVQKFDPTKSGFSVGVGATIATMGDDGYTFSSKVFVLLSIPEMLLIEGKANVLHKRLGISDTTEPPFYAFLVVDDSSIQAGLGVNYNVPDSGAILSLKGEMQLGYFFGNSSAWYLNIGKDQPEDKRIQARLLTLFNSYAYLMVNSKGIKAGAGAKLEWNLNFGPVGVGLYAYIDTKGQISFKPLQLGGAIQLGGGLYIKVFRFRFGFTVDAGLSAEAPKPFVISGFIEVNIKVLIKKFRIRVEFTWRFDTEQDSNPIPLIDSNEIGADNKLPFKAIHMLSGEAFDVLYLGSSTSSPESSPTEWAAHTIPMDSYIDIEFKRPVKPYTNRFGGGVAPLPQFEELVAPQKAIYQQVSHKFSVENVSIQIWDHNLGWIPYNMWEALTAAFTAAGLTVNTSSYNFGNWQYNASSGRYTSLRIASQTPFSVSNGVPLENFGVLSQHLLCAGLAKYGYCQNWLLEPSGNTYTNNVLMKDRNLMLRFKEADGGLGSLPNPFVIAQSLKVKGGNKLEIFFPEPVKHCELSLSALPHINVQFLQKMATGGTTVNGLPEYYYENRQEDNYYDGELMDKIEYDSSYDFIDKIEITVSSCTGNMENIFNQYWNDVSIRLHDQLNEGTLGGDEIELAAQWLDQYHYDPYDTFVAALENLYPLWELLVSNFALSTYDHTQLQNWLNQYASMPSEEDEGASMSNLCMQWTWLLMNNAISPIFRQFLQQWKKQYCVIRHTEDLDLCALYLHNICWLSEKDWKYNQLLQQNNQTVINAGVNSLTSAINEALPAIWRPHSYFSISIDVRDTVKVGDNTNEYDETHCIGFKTAGPLGFYHNTDPVYEQLEGVNKTENYKLANLKHYIDYQRSFPEATGQLVQEKPLYCTNPKLGLFFEKAYVNEFFTEWGMYSVKNKGYNYRLMAFVLDPVDLAGETPAIEPQQMGWVLHKGVTAIPINNLEVETISNVLFQQPELNCISITQALKPPTMHTETTFEQLNKQKLYRAVFKAQEYGAGEVSAEAEVHSYVFRTSMFNNFNEHINSYYRTAENSDGDTYSVPSLFAVDKMFMSAELDEKRSTIQAILNGSLSSSSSLYQDFATPFERIVYGVLGIKEEPATMGVDVYAIRMTVDPNGPIGIDDPSGIFGMLINSVEPFNSPRLPNDQMANTLHVTDEAGGDRYRWVFSKDNARVFITNTRVSLPVQTFTLDFTHIRYNGKDYETVATASLPVHLDQA